MAPAVDDDILCMWREESFVRMRSRKQRSHERTTRIRNVLMPFHFYVVMHGSDTSSSYAIMLCVRMRVCVCVRVYG